ncbi:hypothetical protein PTT_02282 [Pyrenophora teres f. teres 0-1]|uniref:Uncharacterized protein n=1 Tax=Pyrenophora teres f. teres (strain 0-1) TaxID=861557 RepID=E3RDH2_PYRTT|nr:hypothetical protein PTT_02282 [Pyrenophora teres f. teres 0-1]
MAVVEKDVWEHQKAQSRHCHHLLAAYLISSTPERVRINITRSASPAYPQILSIRRQISILAEAATVDYYSTPHRFIWQTAAEPCKLHPDCVDDPLFETDRWQRSDVGDISTPPTLQAARRASEGRGRYPYLSVLNFQIRQVQICGLSRAREEAKRSSGPDSLPK